MAKLLSKPAKQSIAAVKPAVKKTRKARVVHPETLTAKDDEKYVSFYDINKNLHVGQLQVKFSCIKDKFPSFDFTNRILGEDKCEVDECHFDDFEDFTFLTKAQFNAIKALPRKFDDYSLGFNKESGIVFGCGALKIDEDQLDTFVSYLKLMQRIHTTTVNALLDTIEQEDNSFNHDPIHDKFSLKDVESLKAWFKIKI